jgi:hypothetical protein
MPANNKLPVERPPYPNLTIRLEAFYHHLPLSFVLPEIPEELFFIRVLFPSGAWVSGAYGCSCSCAPAPFPASSVVPIALCLRPAFRRCAVVPPATRPASQPPDGRA